MWLPLLWLLIAAGLALLAWAFFEWLPAIIIGALVSLAAFWVFGCVFSPAVPDRKCPACGKDGLVKIRKGEPLGVRCEHCGFVDEQKYVAYLDEW